MKTFLLLTALAQTILFQTSPKELTAQPLTQTVTGRILDHITETPLTGATIVLQNSNPVKGAAADLDGYFVIEKVPVGRHSFVVSYIGYEPLVIPEILVSTGKPVQLEVRLKESTVFMDELVVKPEVSKDLPLNEMAAISARSFTVEETRRYAGGFDDPARLASAYAGVSSNDIGDNGIVIRGNAPKGVQWRIEGTEVPNPSHFQGADVAGAGFFTLLSSQTLQNSDFFTGAFPAEYGNALSGVFDIGLRNGNTVKRSNTFQAGVIGIDFSTEGPFKTGSNATYLVNYRLATFTLLEPFLPEDASTINYQDLSFKLHLPTSKYGIVEVWGVGGLDKGASRKKISSDTTTWKTFNDRAERSFAFDLGSGGITHKWHSGKKVFVKSALVVSGNSSYFKEDVIAPAAQGGAIYPDGRIDQSFVHITGSVQLNVKHSPRWNTRTGVIVTGMDNSIKIQSALDRYNPLTTVAVDDAHYNRYQAYFQTKHSLGESLTVNAGAHIQYAGLVGETTFEPRLAFTWSANDRASFSLGYGKHSMLEDPKIYRVVNAAGSEVNRDLRFTKADHLVLGFDFRVNDVTRIKIEPYYQYLSDVPVIADSSFSMLNFTQDWFFNGDLNPSGAGRNYGIDLTLERFLDQNYYYLISGSIFDATYRDGRGDWHPTLFNRNYNFTALGGKEWMRAGKKWNVVGLNVRLTVAGGQRRNPLDLAESIRQKEQVYDFSNPYALRENGQRILDLTLTLRRNQANVSRVWAFQIKNMLANKSEAGYEYNFQTGQMDKLEFPIVIPNISYKIEF